MTTGSVRDFVLDDQDGSSWRLADYVHDSVVLLFLRGDW
jgi:peroxiredoxin